MAGGKPVLDNGQILPCSKNHLFTKLCELILGGLLFVNTFNLLTKLAHQWTMARLLNFTLIPWDYANFGCWNRVKAIQGTK